MFLFAVFEGVEEYSFKQFTERKERQNVVQKGDGPLVKKKNSLFFGVHYFFSRWNTNARSVAMKK